MSENVKINTKNPVLLDFFEMPRAFGNPIQWIVNTKDELLQHIRDNNGKAPVFISHNSYPTFLDPKQQKVKNVLQIKVSKLFFDFDDEKKPENALNDLLKLADWCEMENIPILPVFSGSKGFHAYVLVKPEVYMAEAGVSRITKGINLWLEQKLGFTTMDHKSLDAKRLCRVLFSKHATIDKKTGQMVINGSYCLPLTPEMVRTLNITQIKEYAKEIHVIEYEPTGDLLTLDEILESFEIDIDKVIGAERKKKTATICDFKPVNDGNLKQLFEEFPCILNQLVNTRNPNHSARVATIIILDDLGYSEEWILEFWRQFNYVDFDEDRTAYQINQIVTHGYNKYSCKRLKEEGICISKKRCNEFKDEVQQGYYSILREKPTGHLLNKTKMKN